MTRMWVRQILVQFSSPILKIMTRTVPKTAMFGGSDVSHAQLLCLVTCQLVVSQGGFPYDVLHVTLGRYSIL